MVASFTSADSNYCGVKGPPVMFTVSPATPSVTVSDPSGAYTGHPFWATGVDSPRKGIGGGAISGGFAYSYYVGSRASGKSSSTAPTAAGTYTVVAAFTSEP